MTYTTGICNLCGTGCGHFAKVSDGKISGIIPFQNHPVSKGRLCVRGWHIHELLRTEGRISTPLIKKNGKFEKADYNEAIDAILNQTKKYNAPDKEIAILGSPRASNEENYLLMKLARTVFKTNNISLSSESGHRNSLNVLYKGTGMAGMLGSLADIRSADYILVAGTDITKQNPIIGSEIHMAARGGTKVVSINSRNTQMSKLAGIKLQIKPGSKKVLLAAMAKALIDGNMCDHHFIQKNTKGFEEFAKSLEELSIASIEEKTGIKYDDIKSAAVSLAGAGRAMAFFASGISGLDEDTIAYLYNLFLMAGKVGSAGSSVNPITGISNLQGGYDMGFAPDIMTGFQQLSDKPVIEKFNKSWGVKLNEKPGAMVYDLLKDPSSGIKSLIVVDHDETIIRQADRIKKLDFIVYIGAFDNGFMNYANVVLPISTYAETDGTYTNTERRVQLSPKKVEAPGGVLPGWKLYSFIAEKASQKWPFSSPAEVMKEIEKLTPAYAGISHDALKNKNGIQWPYNEKAGAANSFTLANVKGSLNFVRASGDFKVERAGEEYPVLLMIGKSEHFWHQNNITRRTFIPFREYNATLLMYPRGYIEISRDDAKNMKVRDKWPVNIKSKHGSMKIDIKVSDDVMPGTAYVPYFIQNMITEFLLEHDSILSQGEDTVIPIRIEKV